MAHLHTVIHTEDNRVFYDMPETSPCSNCGACCQHFRVSFYQGRLNSFPGGFVPVEMTSPVTPLLVCMQGNGNRRWPLHRAANGQPLRHLREPPDALPRVSGVHGRRFAQPAMPQAARAVRHRHAGAAAQGGLEATCHCLAARQQTTQPTMPFPDDNRQRWIAGRPASGRLGGLTLFRRQYVMSMLRVSKVVPPSGRSSWTSPCPSSPAPRSACSASTVPGKSTVLRIANVGQGGIRRRSPASAEHQDRLPAPGTAARPRQDRAPGSRKAPWGEVMGSPARLEAVYAAYAEEDADFDKLAEEQADWKRDHRHRRFRHRTPDGNRRRRACACRTGTPTSANLSGGEKRRVALCKLLLSKPDMLLLGRADQPPRCRIGGMAGTVPGALPGTVWPSPTIATSSTTPPSGFSNWTAATASPGRATTPPGWNRRKPAWRPENKKGRRP